MSGQQLQIWECSGVWQQMFEMVDLPNGPTYHKYQLRPVYNHWCVNVHDLGPLADLVEQPCGHGTGHQDLWVLSY